jgi:hypothetical protein
VSTLAIVIPILRGRSDALTFWNIFLVGGVNFIAIACFEVVYGTFHWEQLQWFQPTKKDVQIFVIGTILFYISIFATYYLFSKPLQGFTSRFFNKWPPNSLTLTISMVAAAFAVSIASIATTSVFFIGPLLLNISQKIIVFAVVFSFCHWFQNKRQVQFLVFFLGVFAYFSLFSMVSFVGRRLLLAVVGAPVICIYWLKWRYTSPKRILAGMVIAGVLTVGVASFYSAFRHARTIHGANANRTFATVFDAMVSTGVSDAVDYVTKNTLHFFSQYTGHYALLTIHLVETRDLEVEPLNSLKFLATYPVPRAIWPGKPNALGLRIVRDVLRLPVETNWGLGIVGHGWHEGGYAVIVLYGFLMVVVIRLMDDAMRRHPDNRFLLATFCAGAPHVLAWTRGDTCTMSAEILEAFAFVWIVGIAGRFIFGTAPAQNQLPMPNGPSALVARPTVQRGH